MIRTDVVPRSQTKILLVVGRYASRAEIDASPAVRLFRERAGTRTQATLDTDRAGRLLGEICRRVDGLPLAIELAGGTGGRTRLGGHLPSP
jgi:predicted ATPase